MSLKNTLRKSKQSNYQDFFPQKHNSDCCRLYYKYNFQRSIAGKKPYDKSAKFTGANIENTQHNLMPIIREKSVHLIFIAEYIDVQHCTSKKTLYQLLISETDFDEQILV